MRRRIAVLLALAGVTPMGLAAQDRDLESDPKHVAVESTVLTLDHARVGRLNLDGLTVSVGDGAVDISTGRPASTVQVGTRIGGLDVSAFLDLVRSERAVRRESTQRILTLSGSAAQVASQRTVVGPYGQTASAGPDLWVEPKALEDGRVRLRVWTAVGDVRLGPFGAVWQDVPIEAKTEITVSSGTPVVIATADQSAQSAHREILGRGSAATTTRAWIVIRPRVVDDPAEAFEMPEGIPEEWLKH